MHPGALLKTCESTTVVHDKGVWGIALVVACQRTKYSNIPWIDERSGERSNLWPCARSWRTLVLCNDKVEEWILDDDDQDKSWMII